MVADFVRDDSVKNYTRKIFTEYTVNTSKLKSYAIMANNQKYDNGQLVLLSQCVPLKSLNVMS